MMFMPDPQPNDGFEWTQAPWGAVLHCRPLLDVAPHFITAATLLLRDRADEWEGVAAFAGVPPDRLRLLHQVHGNDVVVARAGRDGQGTRPTADAIVSDDPSVALVVRVADCAPVLMADRRTGAAAAVHAGWRSTMQRIAEAAVSALEREFGSRADDLVVAIGPSLGSCCAEMGEEVVAAFRAHGHGGEEIERWFLPAPGGRPHFDLWRANRDQLERAGVVAGNIHGADLCTKTHADVFHSYRAAGAAAGRMAAVIRPV
jgi:hypothetical protein